MKMAAVILASVGCLFSGADAVAGNNTSKPSAENVYGGETAADKNSGSELDGRNYQDEVLANPQTSGAARAESVRSKGNSAIIIQNGSSNYSSVIQKGDNNVSEQTQTGIDNELRVEQHGRHNRSLENQSGIHNRKAIRQNDTETIIEQVKPYNSKP
jgi:hypothetical protein